MINYKSISNLSETIKNNIEKINFEFDLIVGIPRSGLLAANLLALYTNKPFTDLDSFLKGKILSTGNRYKKNNTIFKKILILDDSLASGSAMQKAKNKIKKTKSIISSNLKFGVIYIKPGQGKKVDFYFESCKQPRLFEWNIFHHEILNNSCVDIDGILCPDPTEKENDEGKNYLKFIKDTPSKILPTEKIKYLVTCRLEEYRKETENWLKRNHIEYDNLIMMNLKNKKERINYGHAKFKSEVYLSKNTSLFIESSHHQSVEIAKMTNKPVYNLEKNEMLYFPKKIKKTLLLKIYEKIKKF